MATRQKSVRRDGENEAMAASIISRRSFSFIVALSSFPDSNVAASFAAHWPRSRSKDSRVSVRDIVFASDEDP